MQRRNLILGGVAVLGLGGWALSSRLGGDNMTPVNPLANAANAQTADVDTSSVAEMVLGNPDAAVTLTEYASFTCPHCARFHEGPFKQLKADFIDPGKIRFVYREVYFDRYGLWASMIARCGGAERFFGITDMLYKTQSTWAGAGEPTQVVGELRKIGLLAGLDNETLDACLSDAKQAEMLVAWYQQNAEQDQITGTPSFLINGTKHSNMAYPELKGLLDEALGA